MMKQVTKPKAAMMIQELMYRLVTTNGEDEGPKDEIKLLPATVDGLSKGFVSDALLRQDAITRGEFKQLNTMLAESLDEEIN